MKIAIYARQSRDDGKSDTIENQIRMLTDMVHSDNMGEIVGIFKDNNYSGSLLERPGLQLMEEYIANGLADTILVKDLSRLGRSNADMLVYIEHMEALGIRIITYDNTYDSATGSEILGIQTWFNERYVKDISKKIRTTIHHKINSGEFLGRAPYGYIKSHSARNSLEPDWAKAKAVQNIFRLFLEGYTYSHIGYIMNEMGHQAPGGEDCKWNCGNIKRVLTNRVYTGDTVQGTSEKISYKSKKTRKLPQSRWVITEDTHIPIIDKDIFTRVNNAIQQEKERKLRNRAAKSIDRMTEICISDYMRECGGRIICGGCDTPMYKIGGHETAYVCGGYHKYGRTFCIAHRITDRALKTGLLGIIKDLFAERECPAETFKICRRERGIWKNDAAIYRSYRNIEELLSNDGVGSGCLARIIKKIIVYTGKELRENPCTDAGRGYICSVCGDGSKGTDKSTNIMPPFIADGDICVSVQYAIDNQTCRSLSIR